MTPGGICFDATGTLIELNESVGAVYRRIALEYGVDLPEWRLDDAFRRVLQGAPARGTAGDSVAARRQGEVDWWVARIRETFQAADSTIRFDDFEAFASALFETYSQTEAWRRRTGVSAMLTTLHALGWPMAIVSNFDHRLLEILEALDIAQFFRLIEIPSKSGRVKPDRSLFEFVGEALDVPIESLVYVGDDEKAILETIRGLGIRVFDVREIEDLESIPKLVSTAATLSPGAPRAR